MINSQILGKTEEVDFSDQEREDVGKMRICRRWLKEEGRGRVVGREKEQKHMAWRNCK